MEWTESYSYDVDGDGRSIGSAIVFGNAAGVEQGRQRRTRIEPDRIEYRLRNQGPRGREMTPEVDFRLEALDDTRTRVHLDFRATAPLPPGARHLAELLLGRRVRRLHIEDLELLRAHVESAPAQAS